MIADLTEEQKDVLNEYIKNIKSTAGMRSPSDFHYRSEYIINYGEGEDIELLNDNFYELIQNNDLTENQIRKLAKLVSRRENKWIISANTKGIDPKSIYQQCNGYVVLEDGTRIDDNSSYQFRDSRIKYNEIQSQRLAKSKTNGTEFL
ncbi:MAG: hypothetical protein WCR42_00475 [bacterium]